MSLTSSGANSPCSTTPGVQDRRSASERSESGGRYEAARVCDKLLEVGTVDGLGTRRVQPCFLGALQRAVHQSVVNAQYVRESSERHGFAVCGECASEYVEIGRAEHQAEL